MGYTTYFDGHFTIDKPVDFETAILLRGLANTRRVARDIEGYGVEGEFYVGGDWVGVINSNTPPKSQPGLYCQWILLADNQTIEWDENEKFYDYVEWITYIIEKILKPRGYVVYGEVYWDGEFSDDKGVIIIQDNIITIKHGTIVYE